MDTKQLIFNVVGAVVVAVAKELATYVAKKTPSALLGLFTWLNPLVRKFFDEYFSVLCDVFIMFCTGLLLKRAVNSNSPPTRGEVFYIAFFAATLVYWQYELMRDLREVFRRKLRLSK